MAVSTIIKMIIAISLLLSPSYSYYSHCTSSCWGPVAKPYSSKLESRARKSSVKATVYRIEDWYQASYASYYINEIINGTTEFDETNNQHFRAKEMYDLLQYKVDKLSENGYTFEQYQRERLLKLGDAGREIYRYHNISDLDLSLEGYLKTYSSSYCSDCENFWDEFVSIVSGALNRLSSQIRSGTVTVSIGYEADVVFFHWGIAVGMAWDMSSSQKGIFIDTWRGFHLLEAGVEGMLHELSSFILKLEFLIKQVLLLCRCVKHM